MKSFCIGLMVLLAWSGSASAFYGRHATEAMLTFEAEADVVFRGNPTLQELNQEGRIRDRAVVRVDAQVQHLMGSFQSESFVASFGYPGALGETHQIRFTSVREGSEGGRKRFGYEFTGKVVFHKDAFHGHASRLVPIRMPISPDLVYELGMDGKINRCTDREFNSEGDFWYFWDSELPGCPLSGDGESLFLGTGRMERLPNTRIAYPEYDLLYGDNGNGSELNVNIYFGYIQGHANPIAARRDDAGKAMSHFERELRERGFVRTEKVDAFKESSGGRRTDGWNYLRRYENTVVNEFGEEVQVKVQIMLADTGVNSDDPTFHRYLRESFFKADVLVYDGHSELGGSLDLNAIRRVEFDPLKYQILFFNACTSYPYFNGGFFEAKGGSQYLDLVLAGLPTFSTTSGPNAVAFLGPFLDGRLLSYQKILSDLEISNEDWGTSLVGVVGDEDNQFKPER